MNDDSKWATYRNLSFAPIQITNLLQSKTTTPPAVAEADSPLQMASSQQLLQRLNKLV